jgi:tRNA 2-(methylsulfanyl)-N6-isopentenyladenosine37 hydroxylase
MGFREAVVSPKIPDMPSAALTDILPLKAVTPETWAVTALSDVDALLSDHAYLERKAAGNAMELLNRWPTPIAAQPLHHWVRVLTVIARDETEHLAQVTRLLERRGAMMDRNHANPYASDLRKLVRIGNGNRELVDRLLISALIEVRSCERFEILAKHAPADLAKFYGGLCASERGHYLTFVELAQSVLPVDEVDGRWDALLSQEALIIKAQPTGPRMHSGWGGS